MRHILAWYHYDFSRKTGIHVPVTDPRPDLHMSAEEIKPRIQGRYWVVLTGGKLDLTNKHWHAHRVQQTVNRLKSYGLNFVQCGATHSLHIHPPLDGVLNLIGKTDNVRDFWNIILHSEGVICPVTGAMHIAAAFNKPCVVFGGGREEPWFEAYVDNFKNVSDYLGDISKDDGKHDRCQDWLNNKPERPEHGLLIKRNEVSSNHKEKQVAVSPYFAEGDSQQPMTCIDHEVPLRLFATEAG